MKLNSHKSEPKIAIVGGDFSAVELALSLAARWRPVFEDKLHVALVSEDNSLAESGLGSYVSIWLWPPGNQTRMTAVSSAGFLPASAR